MPFDYFLNSDLLSVLILLQFFCIVRSVINA